MALENAKRKLATMPWKDAGIITCLVVSDTVAPIASEPSFNELGTAFIASSVNDVMNGIIMIPITDQAIIALSPLSVPGLILSPRSLKKGATVITAKNPYTTVGIPARISIIGFAYVLTFSEAYCDK